MAIFADTSGIFAHLDADDVHHRAAEKGWAELASRREVIVTSNYVLLETVALAARRLGLDAVHEFQARFVPILQVHWVDGNFHDRVMAAMLTARQRDLSLVDCVSFEVMRDMSLDTVFTFDTHFARRGFKCFP